MRGETLDKRGLNARPRPAVIYGFRNVAVKDAKLKVPSGWSFYDFLERFTEIVPVSQGIFRPELLRRPAFAK